jgi:kynurenine formamidase
MLSDHAGTQLDGLCHATSGVDDHWYNGFRSEDWCTDFGPRRAGAEGIPPIIARGVLVDVARHQEVDALEASTPIGPDDLARALEQQATDVHPGDVVLVRTGSLRYWGEDGHDRERIAGPDTAGITLAGARWLCEEKGAMVIGSDTSALEVVPPVDGHAAAPVHEYLLVEQGVHMGELHYLEDLSAAGVHEFCYIALTPKVRGTTAGFALRPVALI